MDICITLILALEGVLALWLLYRMRLLRSPQSWAAAAVLTLLAFAARYSVLDYVTLDYRDFLSRWVEYFRANGGFAGLSRQIGNYNIPYLYFLALFSYSSIDDLYLIKLLSILFDVLLAWAAALLLGRFTQSAARRLGVFFAVLMLPTVFLNGAVWAQCDSIYTALALLGIYCALDGRPAAAMVLAALSFGFKLQAVFILPVYAVLWIYGKLSWRHFLIFPAVYVALVLPAVLLGRPFTETLTLYLDQTSSIGAGLNYNSPSVYAFFQYTLPSAYNDAASALGVACAIAYMAAVLGVCLAFRSRLTERAVLAAAVLLAIGIPFLLPHMHERYFFAADILSVVLAFAAPMYAAAALLVQFASLLGYHAYLKGRYLLLMDRGAAALIAALVVSAVCFVSSLAAKNPGKREIRS